jgi:hypothetical protein
VQRLGHQREGAVGLAGFLLHGLAEGLEDLAGTALLRQAGIEPLQQAAAEVTPAALQIPILAPQPRVERLPIRRAGAAELAVGRLDGHPFVVMDLGLGPRLAGVEGPQHLARIEQALEGLQRQREAPEHQHLLAGTGDLLDRLHRRQQGRVFVQRVAVAGKGAPITARHQAARCARLSGPSEAASGASPASTWPSWASAASWWWSLSASRRTWSIRVAMPWPLPIVRRRRFEKASSRPRETTDKASAAHTACFQAGPRWRVSTETSRSSR